MASSVASRKPMLDAALSKLLNSNFDADSLTCVQTCLKVVDNILQKPGNEKVRSIRFQNQAMQKKILSKQGGVDILYSCGFVLKEEQQLLSKAGQGDSFLVLQDQNEDTDWLVHVRHALSQVAIHQLKCKPDMLPKFQPPVTKVAVGNGTFGQGFNVYQGARFDGQSAAVGQSLGPPKGWKSATEAHLESLEKKQAQLAKKHQIAKERNWVALRPGEVLNAPPAAEATRGAQQLQSTTSSREDSALIASHIQKQQKRVQEEANRGFTTKAMRDLEKIKKQKVYSHTLLAITFPDGCSCKGQFLPAETVNSVMESIRHEVLTEGFQSEGFELYITPPRTKLLPHQTLTDLDLVPAAKVFVSWKSPAKFKGTIAYLNADLFQSSVGPSMPSGVSVSLAAEESSKSKAAASGNVGATAVKKKKSKAERQAEMLKRMMGK
ncbi:unnamed protein product [Cylindrotheca closterium]|uniref:UBX domain-containing protein n=1 Tax=Cylindrotheca closterium TaxID=2856 RepID=A0AAD2JGB5_9STRA|nr:unnamed protein product [Cylindrotheca closterium]